MRHPCKHSTVFLFLFSAIPIARQIALANSQFPMDGICFKFCKIVYATLKLELLSISGKYLLFFIHEAKLAWRKVLWEKKESCCLYQPGCWRGRTFSGSYQAWNCSVTNVQRLRKLEPLCRGTWFPLTLLCTHSVFDNPEARKTLWIHERHMRRWNRAHLHHWSTPPYDKSSLQSPPLRSGFCPVIPWENVLRFCWMPGGIFRALRLNAFVWDAGIYSLHGAQCWVNQNFDWQLNLPIATFRRWTKSFFRSVRSILGQG